ncbi:MAG: sulfatase [Planctomycetes bacterium]|nr:sulfatase [Planctomycetota bacterium]
MSRHLACFGSLVTSLMLPLLTGCGEPDPVDDPEQPVTPPVVSRTFAELGAWRVTGTPRSPLPADVRAAFARPEVRLRELPIEEEDWELAPGDPRIAGLRFLFHQPRHLSMTSSEVSLADLASMEPLEGATLDVPGHVTTSALHDGLKAWSYAFTRHGVYLALPEVESALPVGARATYPVETARVVDPVRGWVDVSSMELRREALEVDSVQRHGVRLVPGRSLECAFDVPGVGAELQFAYGVEARGWTNDEGIVVETLGQSDGAGVRIVLALDASERVVFETFHPPEAFGRWESIRVDLDPWRGQRVRVRFEPVASRGDEDDVLDDFAMLAEPMLVHRTMDGGRMSVILIVVDTLRADALSCYGASRVETQAIDALAGSGVRFEEVRSTSSWTLPGHASLFTASMTSEHGTNTWTDRLSEDRTTLAEVFRDAGFRTAAFTDGVYLTPTYGMDQGFDLFDHGNHGVRDVVDKARAWLEAGESPAFLFLHTYEVHSPYGPPEPHRSRFVRPYRGPLPPTIPYADRLDELLGRAPDAADIQYVKDLYEAEVAYADDVLGEFFEFLEMRDFFDRGVLALTSDHGEEFFEHGGFAHRTTLYEEQVRIPLVFRGAGAVERLERSRSLPARIVDVAPTLLEFANLPVPHEWSGVTLSLADAERPQLLSLVTRELEHRACCITDRKKWIGPAPDTTEENRRRSRVELYDLDADPGERNDLFEETARSTFQRLLDDVFERFPLLKRAVDAGSDVGSEERNRMRAMGYLGGRGR